MSKSLKMLEVTPFAGLFGLVMVWCSLALGHSFIVIQHGASPMGFGDALFSGLFGFAGFALVWVGMRRSENQATLLGWLGGTMIWCGWFEATWRYSGHLLEIEPVMDNGFVILSPELLMIQATTLIVVAMLIFLGANKDTRCRMFMWFHRNFRLRPDRMTPGYKRQHARTAALETVFLIWTIYLFAIFINDPRGIKYDSTTAVVLTLAFVAWGIYLVPKLLKIRGLGAAFRYAIPTGHICWLPIEGFSRWGLYPEVWVKPGQYPLLMSLVLAVYVAGIVAMFLTESAPDDHGSEPLAAGA
ncbi:MAG: hypothetical protein V2J12_00810 [Gammaproteobacteria bacterium]|jgi:hypothetical protein|nr:hypothetical protein [Gammaproteobacteria bacterium]